MTTPLRRRPPLTLVSDATSRAGEAAPPEGDAEDLHRRRGVDWSILMAHAQAGDQDAYRRLLGEIAPYIRSLVVRSQREPADIEDVVQEVLLTVHAVRHTYDPTRPFGPWLVAIASRRITDRLRRHGRTTARETPLDDEDETFAAPQANYDEKASDDRALQAAIERLPPGQRDAIRLLKLQEMSLKEAASATGMSVAALKVATHRAMKSLQRMFRESDDRS
jgi:RNA polymerase sigma-70 factor (ECF subfamily)